MTTGLSGRIRSGRAKHHNSNQFLYALAREK